MFLITLCLVSLVEFSTLGNGNGTRYDYTVRLVRDSSPSLALVLPVTSCCHGGPSHGYKYAACSWGRFCGTHWLLSGFQFTVLAVLIHPETASTGWALLSYDSTCPTSSHVGMLAQDQYWQLSILQKMTPIFPRPDFHINFHRWPDTVSWGWNSDVVYSLNHAEGWTLRLSSGSMDQWTGDPIIFLLEFQSKQSS